MARQNDVRNLVRKNAPHPNETTRPVEEVISQHNLDLDPDLVAKLDQYRQTRRGPRGGRGPLPRATFILHPEVTRKLKYIAVMETRLYSEVVEEALMEYITKWEGNNGTITLKQ